MDDGPILDKKKIKKKAKGGRKKLKIGGPKTATKVEVDTAVDLLAATELLDFIPRDEIVTKSTNLIKLQDVLTKLRMREGRSMQLTGDARLLIEALEYITLILRETK